jgi:hypothetical protein
MSYFNARGLSALSNDQLFRAAPSVFATEPWEEVSEAYRFIPTSEIVTRLADEGFVPVKARQSRTRIAAKKEFTKHEVRFAHRSVLESGDLVVGGTYPLAVLTNSHDRGSAFAIDAGMYRLACSNGMMLPQSFSSGVRVRHSGEVGNVIEGVFDVVEDLKELPAMIKEYSDIVLPREAQIAFASAALELRESALPLDPSQLLAVRRWDDKKDDLWTVTNRIQENLVKGGLRSRTATGRRTSTRAIADIAADQRLNKSLFVLAEQMKGLVH